MNRRMAWLLGSLPAGASMTANAQGPFETKLEQIGPGVYAIIHERATEEWPQGNSLVVIGDDAVLVVAAGYYPTAARGDIESIRRLTDKPVRYLVNTHWHYDHINGNHEYAKAFPVCRSLLTTAPNDSWTRTPRHFRRGESGPRRIR